MSHRIRPATVLAALAAAVAGLLAAPTPAAALPAECSTGAITEFAGRLSANGEPAVTVAGQMLPCRGTTLPASFTVAYFGATRGVVTPSRIFALRSPTAPTPFTVTATATLPSAICVARRDLAPVDCVRVDHQGAGRLPVVTRIAIDDPLVRKPVSYEEKDDEVGNGCGNCV